MYLCVHRENLSPDGILLLPIWIFTVGTCLTEGAGVDGMGTSSGPGVMPTQQPNGRFLLCFQCPFQRCLSLLILRIEVSAVRNQQLNAVQVTTLCSPVQGRLSVVVPVVNFCAMFQRAAEVDLLLGEVW